MGNLMDTVGQDGRDVGMTQLLSPSNDEHGVPSDVAPGGGPRDGSALSGTLGAARRLAPSPTMGNSMATVGKNGGVLGRTQLLSNSNDGHATPSDIAADGGPHDGSALSGSLEAPTRRVSSLTLRNLMDTVGQIGGDVGMTPLLRTSNDDHGTSSDVATDGGLRDGSALPGALGAARRSVPSLTMGNLMDTIGQNGGDVGMTPLLSTSNDGHGTPSDVASDGGPCHWSALSGTLGAARRRSSTLPFQPSLAQIATLSRGLPKPVDARLECAEMPSGAIRSTPLEQAPEVGTASQHQPQQQQQQRQLEYATNSKIPSFGPTARLRPSTPPEAQDLLPAAGLHGRPLLPLSQSRSDLLVPEEHFSVPESSSEEQRILPRARNPVAAPPGLRRLEEGLHDAPAVDAVVRRTSFWRLSMFTRTLLLAGATVSLVTALLGVVTWKLFQEPLGFDVASNASRHLRMLAPLARGTGTGDVADSNDSLVVAGTGGAVATSPAAPLGGFEDAAPLF